MSRKAAWIQLVVGLSLVGCMTIDKVAVPAAPPSPTSPPDVVSTIPAPLPSPSISATTPILNADVIIPPSDRGVETCQAIINGYLHPNDKVSLSVPPTPTPATYYAPSGRGPTTRISATSRLDGYAWDVAAYWRNHQEKGIEGLQAYLRGQQLLCETGQCPYSVVARDLDKDDSVEYVFTISDPDQYPIECGRLTGADQAAYILDCISSDICLVDRISQMSDYTTHPSVCINGIADVNMDTWPDVIVTEYLSGAMDYFETLEIVSATQGNSYGYLGPRISTDNSCSLIRDQDGDGIKEILSISRRNKEKPLDIYRWDGKAYVLNEWVRVEP